MSNMWLLEVLVELEVTGVVVSEEKALLESTGDLMKPLSGLIA